MDRFFKDRTYATSTKVKRYFPDRLFGRWWFYFRFLKLIFKYRTIAKKGGYDDATWARSSYEMLQEVERCGGKVHIEGLENLELEKEPVVFVANHMSTAETQLLPGIIEPMKKVTFVVKESLNKGLIWGPIMRAREPIAVSQKNPRQDMASVLEKGKELLENGRSVFLFPQGERSNYFKPEEFNTLGIKLAQRAGVRIIPVALKTDFWGNGRLFRPFGPIRRKNILHFSFGPAREIEGNGKQLHREIIAFIQQKQAEWAVDN